MHTPFISRDALQAASGTAEAEDEAPQQDEAQRSGKQKAGFSVQTVDYVMETTDAPGASKPKRKARGLGGSGEAPPRTRNCEGRP